MLETKNYNFTPHTEPAVHGTALIAPMYMASVPLYAAMLHAEHLHLCTSIPYNKHSKINRTLLAYPSGATISLTIPLVKPEPYATVGSLRISDHGNWEHTHWGAIFSAYGKAPFFEHLAPEIYPIFTRRDTDSFMEFCLQLHRAIVAFLDLPMPEITITDGTPMAATPIVARECVGSYYQPSLHTAGFVAGLSILDLAMNTGRDAIIHLL